MGITVYTDDLLRELAGRPGVELSALCSRSSYRPQASVRQHTLPFATDRMAGRLVADHGAALAARHADLWHFPKGHLPAIKPRRPCVGTIHDTIVLHYAERYPETRSALAFAYWRRVLLASLSRFDRICTVSETARGQIEAICAREDIDPPPIDVTYEGARWEEHAGEVRERSGDHPYVLHLGSALPHKRTATLLQRWRELQRRGVELPPLRIVGRLTPECSTLADAVPGVHVEGRADGDALQAIIAGALALLLPSEIEGFGLPALEAFYLGTPVVFTRGTAVQEVLSEFPAGAFELSDADGLRDAVDAALALPPARVAEIAAALRQRFSWARCADRTLESYRAALT
ncbi:MAG: glycosyltransferase family 1 protein [Myxococcales bacterium]|nr:glycosyltransferase family 1 protein [Myxococcales bacterium]